ncbi:MAG: thioredoxin family protein [Saprospiraceae bacterium]
MKTQVITTETIAKAMTYETYRSFIKERLANNQSTGTNHSESMVGYTTLNERRMKRLDKTTKLTSETLTALANIERPQIWLVVTEGWCGDAAQTVPVMVKMAAQSPNVILKLILRDENLDIMDEFLTNGGRSIPKLIVLDKETLEVLGDWGPRPEAAQKLFWEAKARPDFNYPQIQKDLQIWYTKDKSLSTQKELVELIEKTY